VYFVFSVLSFTGDLGAVCATLLEAIPSIEYVSLDWFIYW